MYTGECSYQKVFEDELNNLLKGSHPVHNIPTNVKLKILSKWDDFLSKEEHEF